MTKRAIVYARVSTDDQRGNYSVPTQVDECLRYVKQKGYSVVGNRFIDPTTGRDVATTDGIRAYVDDYSSRELSRPGLDAALVFLETVGFDVVVVHALDRLARDPYIRQTLEMEFDKRGARVEYVLGNYEQTPEGEVRKDLDATFAKWENARRVERSQRGKRGKAESGLFVGGRPPYGYSVDREAQGGLAVNEEQATVIQRVFDLYVHKGYSIRAIADTLAAEQIKNHSGGYNWGKSSVARILANPTYAGTVYYNKYQRTNNGRKLIVRDGDKWIAIQVTPLIAQYIYKEAQRRLASNQERVRKQPARFYLLSGMIVCAHCGKPYFAQTNSAGSGGRATDDVSYRHRTRHGHCRNKQLATHRVDTAVWRALVGLLLEPDKLKTGYESSLKQQEAKLARQKAHLEQLGKERIRLNQRLTNLTTAYVDPDIEMPKSEYLVQRASILDEVAAVQKSIDETNDELASIPLVADYETFSAFSEKIRTKLTANADPTPEEKRALLHLLHIVVYVDVEREALSIEGWFDTEDARLSSITY